jgi:hypothetical protein
MKHKSEQDLAHAMLAGRTDDDDDDDDPEKDFGGGYGGGREERDIRMQGVAAADRMADGRQKQDSSQNK